MPADTPFDTKDYARLLTDLLDAARKGAVPVDDHDGSVARTLLEAFARELTVCYEQLRRVYSFGFLDSAEGSALDKVAALLGLERRRAGHVEGSVTFSRGQAAPEDVPIPAGTLLSGRDAAVFETIEKGAVILRGEKQASVKVRALEPGGKGIDAGRITLMLKPIWGIDSVSNPLPLALSRHEETDDELRERARYWLERVNLGTVGAIEQAVRSLGIAEVTVKENEAMPGEVTVVLGDPDLPGELIEETRQLLQKVRPAGVRVTVQPAGRVYVRIAATLVLREDHREEELRDLRAGLETSLKEYVRGLKIGELVRVAKVDAILAAPQQVSQLQNIPGEKRLNAFAAKGDALVDATNLYGMLNGDLRLGENDRAMLDTIRLILEPPVLDVWVDVAFDTTLTPEQEDAVRNSLQVKLDTLKPGKPFSYADLSAGLPSLDPRRTVTRFTVIHTKDNLSLDFTQDASQTDALGERERLTVGRLVGGEVGHG